MNDFLFVASVHGADAEEEVIEVHRGDDDAEDADAGTDALRFEIVMQKCGSIEAVAVVLQLVTFVEVVYQLLVGYAVGRREDIPHVVDGIVYPVGLDTVVRLDALPDVIVHLGHHRLLVGDGEVADGHQYDDDAHQGDELTKTTVP